MNKVLNDFMSDTVALYEMEHGVVGKLMRTMIVLGLSRGEWGANESQRAWKIMRYMSHYCKADLKKVMSSPEAYDVLKAKLEELRQQRGL